MNATEAKKTLFEIRKNLIDDKQKHAIWLAIKAISAIFDEKTEVIEGRQKELEKAIVNLHDAIKELED